MTRGGHKGLLFPISGVSLNFFGRRRKRGLYHHCTNEIFRPSWGPIKQPIISNYLNLLKWKNGTISASEMLPSHNVYGKDVRSAWPTPRHEFISRMYDKNEYRYFKPSLMANSDRIRNYIYNVLDPTNSRNNLFIGTNSSPEHTFSSQHISKIINLENDSSLPKINLDITKTERRFKKLEHLIKESDSWRTITHHHQSSTNPFPHVNEGASLIRNLPISEVLYTRGNHRLGRRAHPKWYTARYRKFMKKKELNEKLNQLHLETSTE
uniref:Uncharacterized protein n=1 Tax=Theileria annulata TaxID=5874 RepID=A0A3B0MHD6_THEAN